MTQFRKLAAIALVLPFSIGTAFAAGPGPDRTPADVASKDVPATIDTNNDGKADAWDRDANGAADAWDNNADGKPDSFDDDGDGKPDKAAD